MTAKKAPARLTRKHIARAERDRALRNRIMMGTIAVGILVIGLLAYGWYQAQVVVPGIPVAVVNGQEILTAELQSRVRLGQMDVVSQISQIQQFMPFLGDNSDLLAQYENELLSLQQELANPQILGSSQLDGLIQERLIIEEARRRGITVSEADIDRAIEESLGYYAEGTPTPLPTAATTPETASTPADEGTPIPTSTVPADSTPSPTATAYTRELFETNLEVRLSNMGIFRLDEQDLRDWWLGRLYRQRLLQAFESEVSPEQDQVWARHILVSEEELALELLERVEAGESWVDLAAEFSEDTSNKDDGGDLGWFGRGRMVEPFEQAAFQAEVGEIVGPVETDFGWHLIEVLGHEVRQLDASGLQIEASRAFNEWLSSQLDAAEITIANNWDEHLPQAPLLTQ